MDLLQLTDFLLHLDSYLGVLSQRYGLLTYGLIFLIIFLETGLVITPFLPGDSLLFAAGALAAAGALEVTQLFIVVAGAAIIGDAANYHIGKFLGPKVFRSANSRFFKKEYLERTRLFYKKYGNKTIVLARFVPIVRTFAPFVAGLGSMNYARFAFYNVSGALLWSAIFIFGGYYFGSLSFVKNNFTLFILGVILISLLPGAIEYSRRRSQANKSSLENESVGDKE